MTAINKGIVIKLPDGSYTTSTHTAFLPITGIPKAAVVSHILPNLKSGSLLSVGQLCEYGCEATLTKHTVCITADGNTVLTGTRPMTLEDFGSCILCYHHKRCNKTPYHIGNSQLRAEP
jgi:hypothetical protein